jgi:hypothetical protein
MKIPRDVNVPVQTMVNIINDAWAWGVWLRKMSVDAMKLHDDTAADKLGAMSDAVILRATIMADAIGHTFPGLPPDLMVEMEL